MSLVEKAIQKLQQSQRAASLAGTGTHAKLVFGAVTPADRHEGTMSTRRIVIDQDALRAAGLLPPEHQERQIAQQYRQIKRPLIGKATGRSGSRLANGHLIMMASAMPGEGKTFTSINLAFSMALEKDIRVLLVDADVPKPHISRLLGVEEEPGLLDVLRDAALDIEALILPTNIPGLFMLPVGKRSDNATELLASERMRAVMMRLGERDPQRIVLLDSPPLLLTTESHALAQIAGQIVMVVRADETPQRIVLDALSHLEESATVSLVLNQSVAAASSGYYYYGYG